MSKLTIHDYAVKSLKTLDYGNIPVTKNPFFLKDHVIDNVEDCKGNIYEIRSSIRGVICAYQVSEGEV